MNSQGYSPYPRGQGSPGIGLPPGANFEVIGVAFERFKERPGPFITMALLYIMGYFIQVGLSFFINGPSAFGQTSDDLNVVLRDSLSSSGWGVLGGMISTTVLMCLVCGAVEMLKRPQESGLELSGFKQFFPMLGLVAVTQTVITIGFLVCFLPGILLMGLFSLAPMLVGVQRMGILSAMTESIEKMKPYVWVAGFLMLVLNIIYGVSFMLCCVGALLGGPILMIGLALHYLSNFPEEMGLAPSDSMGPEVRF